MNWLAVGGALVVGFVGGVAALLLFFTRRAQDILRTFWRR